MSLKPRLSNSIGMLLGGLVLAWFGIGAAVYLSGYLGLLPGVFGVLGILWVVLGILALAWRSQLAIVIDEARHRVSRVQALSAGVAQGAHTA